jgi:hypothetical protein
MYKITVLKYKLLILLNKYTKINNMKYYKIRIVIPVVVGSSPISHPITSKVLILNKFFRQKLWIRSHIGLPHNLHLSPSPTSSGLDSSLKSRGFVPSRVAVAKSTISR